MSGGPWTSEELRYLEEHCGEGAEAVARALGRSVRAVEAQASRWGLSLRERRRCPRCGMPTARPLSAETGWCHACTREARLPGLAEEVALLEEQERRAEAAGRERQRLYSRRHRARRRAGGGKGK